MYRETSDGLLPSKTIELLEPGRLHFFREQTVACKQVSKLGREYSMDHGVDIDDYACRKTKPVALAGQTSFLSVVNGGASRRFLVTRAPEAVAAFLERSPFLIPLLTEALVAR